jgi:hypothetical protein
MSRKGEMLRTQAVQHILHALGHGQVNIYSRSPGDSGEYSGGVILADKDRIFSDTYWLEQDGTTTRLRVLVTVEMVEEPR